MKKCLNFLLSYVLVASSLMMPASSYALTPTNTSGFILDLILPDKPDPEYDLTEKNFKYIVHFKSYVNALLRLQAAEVKKKLVCLGYSGLANLRFDDLEDQDLGKELKDLFLAYRETPECEEFRTERVKTLTKMYRDMKINLALHRSSPNEVLHKVMNANIAATGSFGATRMNDLDIMKCDQIEIPLVYDRTDFCIEKLITIINPKPVHVLKKISIEFLDEIFNAEKLPKVASVTPLTWREVEIAVKKFQEKFINSHTNTKEFVKGAFEEALGKEELTREEIRRRISLGQTGEFYEQNQSKLGKYYGAADFQAHGMHIFSKYPEDSAPRIYSEIIAKEPVLAFFEPKMKKVSFDCADVDFNMYEICNQYLEYVDSENFEAYTYVQDYNSIIGYLAKAYKKVLTFNELLIESLNMSYDSNQIYDEDLKIKTDLDPEEVEDWRKLVKLEKAIESFNEMYPDFKGGEKQFQNIQRREEIKKLALTLTILVGGSIVCGFIGNVLGAVSCLAATGIVANLHFYNESLKTHAQMMKQFFSNPGQTSEGFQIDLVSFDQMKQEDQGLVIEVAMVGVGTSIGPIFKKVKTAIFKILNKGT